MPITQYFTTQRPIDMTASEIATGVAIANLAAITIIPAVANTHIIVYKIYVRSSVAGRVNIERNGFAFADVYILANLSFLIDFGDKGFDVLNGLAVLLRNVTGGAADFTVTSIFDYAENPA